MTSEEFKPSDAKPIILPLSNSNFWLKFTINNQSNHQKLLMMIENSSLDESELYYQKNGVLYIQKISNNKNFNARKYKHQHAIFDLNLAQGTEQTYYLKVHSSEQMFLPIYVRNDLKISAFLNNENI